MFLIKEHTHMAKGTMKITGDEAMCHMFVGMYTDLKKV